MIKYIFILLILTSCRPQSTSGDDVHDSQDSVMIVDENINKKIELHNLEIINYDTLQWAEILPSENIQLDIRYATTNNFTKEIIYDCPRCFIRRSSLKAFENIVADLKRQNYGIKLFDCYRPHPAQEKLWSIVTNPMYVADPKKGSMHNRGHAIDVTLTDLNGKELDMGTPFDFFGKRAYHDFTDLPVDILQRRRILKETMASHGFQHIRTEWWHYSDENNWSDISSFEWACN